MDGPWQRYGGVQPAPPGALPTIIQGPPREPPPRYPDEGVSVELRNRRLQQEIEDNPATIANTRASAARTQQQTTQADTRGANFQDENALGDDYRRTPAVTAYETIMPAYTSATRAGPGGAGDLQIIYAFGKVMDPGSVVREGEQQMAAQSGGLSERLQGWVQSIRNGGRLPADVRARLIREIQTRAQAAGDAYRQVRADYRNRAIQYGFNPDRVIGPNAGQPFQQAEADFLRRPVHNLDGSSGPRPHGEVLPQEEGSALVHRAPPGTHLQFNDEAPDTPFSSTQMDAYDTFMRTHPQATAAEIRAFGASIGRNISNAEAIVEARDAGAGVQPGYNARFGDQDISDQRQGSELRSVSPLERTDAAVRGAANAVTLGFADRVAAWMEGGNYQDALHRQHEISGYDWRHYPVETLGGTIAGGAALNNFYRPNSFLQGVATDTGYAGVTGFNQGEGDVSERLNNALLGVAAGGPLSALGRSVAGVTAPRSGRLGPLYEQGVNPTVGQRMGGAADRVEQAFTSVPLVGGIQRSARNEAIDQFQRGAINQALEDIGERLPANVRIGTEGQGYLQRAFNREFRTVRSQMRFAPDNEWTQDFGRILTDAGSTLPEDSARRFRSFVQNKLASRLRTGGGSLSGDGYVRVASEFDRQARQFRRAGEMQLADALEEVSFALDSAAARQSGQAVADRLVNARRGYRKAVIIEDAAQRRGGGAGTFSPVQFDAAVQRVGGGEVRSRAYLRGEAPLQDYAQAGLNLGDTVPNSGSVDRFLATSGVIGVAAAKPIMLAPWAMNTLLNLPGVRKGVGALMDPTRRGASPGVRRGIEDATTGAAIAGAEDRDR